jgi:fluoride ion exporter CrcB/FEX
MPLLKAASEKLSQAEPDSSPETAQSIRQPSRFSLKKLRGSLLFIIGYLLSPLCWWNDLILNLPVAYAFGYICRWFSASWFVPGLIVGYWLSNLVGILLMQFGAIDVFQGESKPHNLKKDLVTGVVSSTIYTLVILALVQFHILDPSSWLSSEGLLNLSSLLPSITN